MCRPPGGCPPSRRSGRAGTSPHTPAARGWHTGRGWMRQSTSGIGATMCSFTAWVSAGASERTCGSASRSNTARAARACGIAPMKDFVVEERSRMGSRTAVIRAALAGALLAVATATAAAQVPTIAPADQVRVTVVATELPTGPFTVDADGSIDYPFLGRIEARGLTARALGDLIAKRLVEA